MPGADSAVVAPAHLTSAQSPLADCAQPFWEAYGQCGSGANKRPCHQLEWLLPPGSEAQGGIPWHRFISMAAFTRQPVLVAMAAAEAGPAWDRSSDIQLAASAMAALRAMFPGRRLPAAPRAVLASRWGTDPWAHGSLSYYTTASRGPADRATLAEPQSGSLLLAGEGVWAAHPSTVHGAMLSGQDAALRVLSAAGELPVCGSGSGGSVSVGSCVAAPRGKLSCQCDALLR